MERSLDVIWGEPDVKERVHIRRNVTRKTVGQRQKPLVQPTSKTSHPFPSQHSDIPQRRLTQRVVGNNKGANESPNPNVGEHKVCQTLALYLSFRTGSGTGQTACAAPPNVLKLLCCHQSPSVNLWATHLVQNSVFAYS